MFFQAIMAEGKQHALAIGYTKMSAKDIRTINKGIGVDNMHYLNDGLWKVLLHGFPCRPHCLTSQIPNNEYLHHVVLNRTSKYI
ncbi:pseudouridine synthase and archaeosine transglycosylase (PUA) domain-containing protein [Zea mays]|uniref:Pseudouridine synthase and archaeosine transglycosylase (PUA) domain-containing protein n=1 Tax=Zea mays TaxID=4577 RepID=A0A1D6FHM6_MAIZE|nr:pseudouridine synthase and archaeosine transglycosylase (PUA) domain-containing protein [Zea mays]